MIVFENASTIKNEANKCVEYVNDFKDNRKKIEELIEEIGHIWKEKEYENFCTKMNEFVDELKQFESQIDSYNNFANGYVLTEQILDTQYQNKKIIIE